MPEVRSHRKQRGRVSLTKYVVGWPSGEVGRHAVTYEIKEGRLVPKTKTK
jgi:hypothetical protein